MKVATTIRVGNQCRQLKEVKVKALEDINNDMRALNVSFFNTGRYVFISKNTLKVKDSYKHWLTLGGSRYYVFTINSLIDR